MAGTGAAASRRSWRLEFPHLLLGLHLTDVPARNLVNWKELQDLTRVEKDYLERPAGNGIMPKAHMVCCKGPNRRRWPMP
jgi:hypothetical protein